MKKIDGKARTVRELLDGAKYTIDFYQREYAWKERQVHELVDDLTGKFLDFYDDAHSPDEVANYGHYFLGSVVISHKNKQKFIVDGQQRLTTLTLLLIYLHHRQKGRADKSDVKQLIYSEEYRRKSFNLDVPDRAEVMEALFSAGTPNLDEASESVRNIAARYDNIVDYFPEDIAERALPFFVDWLKQNVHLVEIEAYSDEDAYTIFETMNDRGLSLSLPEMLKGYLLANIRHEGDQRAVNALWKAHMNAIKELGDEEDVDFFKNWLRARHADTIRPGKKGAENKDYERIGSEFHRWVRDQRERMLLTTSDTFVRFVKRDFDFYARQTMVIRNAARKLTEGLESIRYNEERGFTLQTQVLLAALDPDDPAGVVHQKLKLVADFLDIWLARRVWCFRTISYSSVRYTAFVSFTKPLRGMSVPELSAYLQEQLEDQAERFASQPRLRLHKQNYRQVRHVLARITHWVDDECGFPSNFEDLISQGRARPYEIEHIWADHYERFKAQIPQQSDFDTQRNRLGGLLLLQRGLNQSLNDAPYEEKRDAYVSQGQNLLARSLHPLAYESSPAFKQFMKRTGLSFKPYETFNPEEQAERQELYVRLAEWVWNPYRLDLGAPRPPEHEPLVTDGNDDEGEEDGEDGGTPKKNGPRQQKRLKFNTKLLDYSKARTDLHAGITPRPTAWSASRRHGVLWAYVVLEDAVRIEVYLDGNAEKNKATFDKLYASRSEIEAAYGGKLDWQRLGDKQACRICDTIPGGGWVDEGTWDTVIPTAFERVGRLYAAFSPRLGLSGSA